MQISWRAVPELGFGRVVSAIHPQGGTRRKCDLRAARGIERVLAQSARVCWAAVHARDAKDAAPFGLRARSPLTAAEAHWLTTGRLCFDQQIGQAVSDDCGEGRVASDRPGLSLPAHALHDRER